MHPLEKTAGAPAIVVENQSQQEYSSAPGYRSSELKQILVTPSHFQHYLHNKKPETPAMRKGTALHAALLEPELFAEQFAIVPKVDKRSKAGKEEWQAFNEANVGKTLIESNDAFFVETLRYSIQTNEKAKRLLEWPGRAELSLYWTDPSTGIQLKARPDRLLQLATPLYVEVKSTTNASKAKFRERIAQFDYDFSIAMYREGLKCVYGELPPAVFLVIEDITYQICLYTPDEEMLSVGLKRYRQALNTLAACLESNRWPGYQPEALVEDISLPRWALQRAA